MKRMTFFVVAALLAVATTSFAQGVQTGTIRGTLNINSGATVRTLATDALGFTGGVAVDTVEMKTRAKDIGRLDFPDFHGGNS